MCALRGNRIITFGDWAVCRGDPSRWASVTASNFWLRRSYFCGFLTCTFAVGPYPPWHRSPCTGSVPCVGGAWGHADGGYAGARYATLYCSILYNAVYHIISYIYIYIYVCIYIYIYVILCVYKQINKYMCVCIYIYIYITVHGPWLRRQPFRSEHVNQQISDLEPRSTPQTGCLKFIPPHTRGNQGGPQGRGGFKHPQNEGLNRSISLSLYIYIYISIYIYIYIYMYIHIYIYIYIHVYMHDYVCITYICIYIYIYIYKMKRHLRLRSYKLFAHDPIPRVPSRQTPWKFY